MEDTMHLRSLFTVFALAGTILTAGGCGVSHSDLERYATVSQLDTVRGELMAEMQKVLESSAKIEQSTAAAANSAQAASAAAQTAAASAQNSSQKADYIYKQSLKP
jgi:hypothetical protein